MKKGVIIGLATVMLLLASGMAMAGDMSGTGDASGHGDMNDGGMHGHTHMDIGTFNYTNGVATGTFVDFNINPQNGEITNYVVNGTTVFSSVTYSSPTVGKVTVHGSTLTYLGIGAAPDWNMSMHNPIFKSTWTMVSAHDVPSGVLHIVQYGENNVTYTLAPGEQAKITGNHTLEISGTLGGTIIYTGTAQVSGNTITIALGTNTFDFGNYSFKGGSAVFISDETWQHLSEQLREKLMNAIAQGKVGGELKIHGNREDFVNYTYGFNVQVQNNEKNKIQVQVQAESHEGKVMIMDINKSQMQYDAQHQIKVKLDGKELKMSSETEVLAAQGTEGKYAVVDNGNYVTVMVYIPHFSDHTLDVESQPTVLGEITGNPLIIGAIVAAIVIVAVAAVVVIKRR